MKGTVNGVGINGTALPNWVVRAVVVAVAAATPISVEQTRTTFGSVNADASVVVTLTQTHTIAARANALAQSSASLSPSVIYSGATNTTASAFGSGAVRRDVFAEAGGDATATGEALTAQALGDANTSSSATVVSALAHIIHPGRANTPCVATGVAAAGDVTRYTSALGALSGVSYTRGEASITLNGEAFTRHDGFVPLATSGCTGTNLQDKTIIIATFGDFGFAQSYSIVGSYMIFSARAAAVGTATAVEARYIRKLAGVVDATATLTANVTGVRVVLPTVARQAGSVSYALRANVNHSTRATDSSGATSLPVTGLRTAYASTSAILARAYLVSTVYGNQRFGAVSAAAGCTGTIARPLHNYAGRVLATAQATSIDVAFGRQYPALANNFADATVTVEDAIVDYKAHSLGTATAELSKPLVYGTQHFGNALTSAVGVIVETRPVRTVMARATPTAGAWVGRAYAVANSDQLAPDERYIIVPPDARSMIVFNENREMKVAA